MPYWAGTSANASFNDEPRGYQNSSASLLITQSAPNSVAARRAIRVTHSPWRRPFGRLADQVEAARALVRLEDLGRAVLRGVVRRDHEVDARVEMERDLRVDDVRLVAREHREDELHRRAARFTSRPTLRYDAPHRSALDRVEAAVQRVDLPLQPDEVRLARARSRRSRRRRRRRRSAARTTAGCDRRPAARRTGPRRAASGGVTEARVLDERAVLDPALEGVVVDHERVVELVEPPLLAGAMNLVVVRVAARAERRAQVRVLAVRLLEAAEREVEELDRVPARAAGRAGCRGASCAPADSVTFGSPRWIAFRFGRKRLFGSLIGAEPETRAVIRSAKNRSSSGRGTNWRSSARTIP